MIKIDQDLRDDYRLHISGQTVYIDAEDAQLLMDAFARKSELSSLRTAARPFVDAYGDAGGTVPADADEAEQMLYQIFNTISLEDFAALAARLDGQE